jgi:hypothetical protein
VAMKKKNSQGIVLLITNDPDCGCYRCEAPQGFRFINGPHGFVSWYWNCGTVAPGWRTEALKDIRERIEGADGELEPCPEEDCDICNPAPTKSS